MFLQNFPRFQQEKVTCSTIQSFNNFCHSCTQKGNTFITLPDVNFKWKAKINKFLLSICFHNIMKSLEF